MNRIFAIPEKHTRILEFFVYQDKNKEWCLGGKDAKGLGYVLPRYAKFKEYGYQKANLLNTRRYLKYSAYSYLSENESYLTPTGYKVSAPRAGFYWLSGFKERNDYK